MTAPDSFKREASEIKKDEELAKKSRNEMNALEAAMDKTNSITTEAEVVLRAYQTAGLAQLGNTTNASGASFRFQSTCKASAHPIESYKENQMHMTSPADSKLPGGLPSLDSLIDTLPSTEEPLAGDCEDAYGDDESISEDTRHDHFINLPCYLLNQGGVSPRTTEQDIILYVRPRCLKQMVFMYDDVIRRGLEGHIFGQPGTGKSTTALYVAVQLAVEKRWNVLWAHLEASSTDLFWKCIEMRPEGTYSSFAVHDETFREAVTRFERTRAENGHLLIMDGIRFDDSRTTKLPGGFWLYEGKGRRRIIKISSDGRRLKLSSKARDGKIRIFRQWSWTLEEYESAIASNELRECVEGHLDVVGFPVDLSGSTALQQKVRQKYHVAGGCARWMFSCPTDTVKAEINSALRTDDFDQRLFSRFERNRAEIVSDYAMLMMATRFQSGQIKQLALQPFLKQCDPNNSLFLVNCLHEFRRRIKERIPIELTPQVGMSPILYMKGIETRGIECATREACPVDKLIWCIKGCQQSFDAFIVAQHDNQDVVICIKFTVGKSHQVDLGPIREITRRLGAHLCELCFVVPIQMKGRFQIGDIINPDALEGFGWPKDVPDIRLRIMIAGLDG